MLQVVTGGSELEAEVNDPLFAEDVVVTPFFVFFLKTTQMQFNYCNFDMLTGAAISLPNYESKGLKQASCVFFSGYTSGWEHK